MAGLGWQARDVCGKARLSVHPVQAVTAHCAAEGSAAYVGLERICGTLHGRVGSFVLHHSASVDRGVQSATWTVVPDSGDGALTGLTGVAEIVIDASWWAYPAAGLRPCLTGGGCALTQRRATPNWRLNRHPRMSTIGL
ncbi:MAG: hypothetical protein NVSMB32_14870 [Actinomycetota bacterium]